MPVSFGFHPYLRLPDVAARDWQVELPAMPHLELDGARSPPARRDRSRRTPARWARGPSTTAWTVPDGAAFVVAGGGRRVTVRLETGYPAAQVFAPRATTSSASSR